MKKCQMQREGTDEPYGRKAVFPAQLARMENSSTERVGLSAVLIAMATMRAARVMSRSISAG